MRVSDDLLESELKIWGNVNNTSLEGETEYLALLDLRDARAALREIASCECNTYMRGCKCVTCIARKALEGNDER